MTSVFLTLLTNAMSTPPAPPPTPDTTPVIDHAFLGHIFDAILSDAPLEFFRNLRGTSKAMYARANAVLYRHVCISVKEDDNNPGRPLVLFREPYRGKVLPGLRWDVDREQTLDLLRAHTRVVDDRGSAANLWNYSPSPARLEAFGALSLLYALRPDVLRAAGVYKSGHPYPGWAQAVNNVTDRRYDRPGDDTVLSGDVDSFPSDLDPNNEMHHAIAATRTLKDDEDDNSPTSPPLLPGVTSIIFTTVSADGDPLVPDDALPPSTTRVIVNVSFSEVAGTFSFDREFHDFPPGLQEVVIVIGRPPTDFTWTWVGSGPGQVGVLQDVVANLAGSNLRITLVGVERMDPAFYGVGRLDLSTSSWDDRRHALMQQLSRREGQIFADPPATWRLLTFADWREEVGDELYVLATVAPWDKWPERLPHTTVSMAR